MLTSFAMRYAIEDIFSVYRKSVIADVQILRLALRSRSRTRMYEMLCSNTHVVEVSPMLELRRHAASASHIVCHLRGHCDYIPHTVLPGYGVSARRPAAGMYDCVQYIDGIGPAQLGEETNAVVIHGNR